MATTFSWARWEARVSLKYIRGRISVDRPFVPFEVVVAYTEGNWKLVPWVADQALDNLVTSSCDLKETTVETHD